MLRSLVASRNVARFSHSNLKAPHLSRSVAFLTRPFVFTLTQPSGPLAKNISRLALYSQVRFASSESRAPSDFSPSEKAHKSQKINLRSQLSSPEDASGSFSSNGREFQRMFHLVRMEKGALAGALMLLLFSSAIGLSLPFVIGKILDAVNDPSPEKMILGYPLQKFILGMAGVFFIGSIATYYRVVLIRSISERMVTRLRSRAFKGLLKQDAEFFDANRTGDLISRLSTDANVVSRSVTQNMADGLRSLLTAGMGVGMLCYMSLKLTGIITLCLPPVMVGTWLYGRKVRQISKSFQTALGDLTKVSEERLNNISTSRSFGGETQELKLYHGQLRNVFSIAMQEARASGLYLGMMQMTGNYIVIGLLAIGAVMVSNGSLTFGELSSFIMYTAYSGSALSGLASFYSDLMKGAGAAQRLFEIEEKAPLVSVTKGQRLNVPKGDIVFHNVQFSYPTRPAVKIFTNVSMQIRAGSNVCIVGQSGGGKSTVLSLLLRFYDPTSGYITIGGQNIADVSPWDLRRHIGVVSQEPVLYNATVAENISYACPEASREEIVDAARQANCTFLEDFPEGIDTPVGPRGTQLSGGQKQRIAIARAIIKKPSILVLDEATSALDGESEMLVNAALAKLIKTSSTTISVAHRLSTIARSNDVIVLGSNGQVIEQGSFAGLYRDSSSELSKLLMRRNEVVKPDNGEGNAEEDLEEDSEDSFEAHENPERERLK
nr:Mdr2 [Starmerella bombicola]